VTGKSSGVGIPDIHPSNISLTDEYGRIYKMKSISPGDIIKGSEAIDAGCIEFIGGPELKSKMALVVNRINNVEGKWNLEFEMTPHVEVSHFKSDAKYEFENGTELTVTDVTSYLTNTYIQAKYDVFINSISSGRSPSVPYNIDLHVDGKKYRSIQSGVVDYISLYATFEPISISLDSKVELEFQLGMILGDDGLPHPNPDNIIRKQIILVYSAD
jgi:hypothetical protein